MFSVRTFQFEHLEDAGSGVESRVGGLATERLDLQSEGNTSLASVFLGSELGGNAVNFDEDASVSGWIPQEADTGKV